MSKIKEITKQTLINLSKHDIDATPSAYAKEFCNIANKINFSTNDCEYFKNALLKLSNNEISNFKEKNNKNITTMSDLIDVLLQRVEPKNIDKMSKLMQNSMKPSISLSISDDLKAFSIKIGDTPSLIFEESIQEEMEKFIEQRFEVDKKVVAQKTADIAKLITLMSQYLGDAIQSNKNGSSNVSDIKNEIKSVNISDTTTDTLNNLQTKLVAAAQTIEDEIKTVNNKLESGQNEVSSLHEKIKQLEQELLKTKQESATDPLTGLLTRRAYDQEVEKFEENFTRLGHDYALIFFDIDHFKKVNDTYGHDCGDSVLRTFAQILLKLTRKTDIIGRYGGEEFVALLQYNSKDQLIQYIKRVKEIVTSHKFKYKDLKLDITFSAGCDIRSNHDNYSNTIHKADELLYEAKNNGRNQIIIAPSYKI